VQFTLPIARPALVIPANTLLFRKEGLQVGVVDEESRVLLKPVTLGHDFGTTVEVASGLQSGDSVIRLEIERKGHPTRVRIARSRHAKATPAKRGAPMA
jgi:hypothetical protein